MTNEIRIKQKLSDETETIHRLSSFKNLNKYLKISKKREIADLKKKTKSNKKKECIEQ